MMPIGTRLAHFRIVALLGAGGMGEVYRARDERLHRDVALKLFTARDSAGQGQVDRFLLLREAQAASALNHPNIVTIHEAGETDQGQFIVMELVDGRALRDVIGRPMPVETLVQLGTQMARALTAAHAAGITHRDIKPENIMVRGDGYVKILDFGLARVASPSSASTGGGEQTDASTQPGTLMGTLRYMSPEQALGRAVGTPTDVFSLGLVFYELVTGQHPFGAESGLSTLNAIAFHQALRPLHLNPDVPTALDALILRMLEKNPLLRPSAADVASTLLDLGGDARVPAPRLSVGHRVVGRGREIAQMTSAFESAAAGRGLVLCVAGEPGLGKTTLVEGFLTELRNAGRQCWTARGRCSERLAGTEAYLPFLEALDSMIRSSRLTWATPTAGPGESVAGLLRMLAPSWYSQVAPLAADTALTHQAAPGRAVSQEQMKRELLSFFQEVSRIRPFVLFLDDLQWADASTTDLLAYLAVRLPSMPMLVLAAYRQSDLLLGKHPFIPLKLDLQSRGILRELGVDFLTREDVEQLLALEFANHEFPQEFVQLIHTKTEGNPLFIVDLLHDLRSRQVIAELQGRWTLAAAVPAIERELPESVRSMIRRKIDQLGESDRKLLTAASVQGPEFESTIVARALALDPAEVEERLTVLEFVHAFVRRVGEHELPDGSVTVVYHFVHVLYQNALYASLTPTRRMAVSAAVAGAIVGAYGERNADVATELALLFEAAREFNRAAQCFLAAAQHAARIFAHHEVVTLSRRGIALVAKLPPSGDRDTLELSLQIALGSQLLATQGYAARELGDAYARARVLCDQIGETPLVMPALLGLATFHTVRGEYTQGRGYAEELLLRAQQFEDAQHPTRANILLGVNACMLGQLVSAVEQLEPCTTIAAPRDGSWTSVYGAAPGVSSRGYLAFSLILLGYPDQALRVALESVRLARDLAHPLSMVSAGRYAWWIYQLRREQQAADEHTSTQVTLSTQQGFTFYTGWGRFQRGWASTNQPSEVDRGLGEMREGAEALRAAGAAQLSTYRLALLAEAYLKAQRPSDGLRTLDEAMAFCETSGETFFEAELRRMRGELLLLEPSPDRAQVERSFLDALEIARRQEAKWLELRAARSVARLWRHSRREEGVALVKRVYSWFTEGFNTPDLQDAKVMLADVS